MSSNKKEILRAIIRGFLQQKSGKAQHYTQQNGVFQDSHSQLQSIKSGAPFALLSIFAIVFFVIFGIYELLFNSPLSIWISDIWNSIMSTSPQKVLNASPQNIADMPNQILTNENLMQKPLGEWLGFVPNLLGQIVDLISAPMTSILGVIIVFVAMAVRLGRHILGLFSTTALRGDIAKTISWIILALSFAPLAIEHL